MFGSSVSLMADLIFKRLDIGEFGSTNISLQLVDHYIKYLLGISKNVPIKVVDFYVLIDFVILDMAKDAHT